MTELTLALLRVIELTLALLKVIELTLALLSMTELVLATLRTAELSCGLHVILIKNIFSDPYPDTGVPPDQHNRYKAVFLF